MWLFGRPKCQTLWTEDALRQLMAPQLYGRSHPCRLSFLVMAHTQIQARDFHGFAWQFTLFHSRMGLERSIWCHFEAFQCPGALFGWWIVSSRPLRLRVGPLNAHLRELRFDLPLGKSWQPLRHCYDLQALNLGLKNL